MLKQLSGNWNQAVRSNKSLSGDRLITPSSCVCCRRTNVAKERWVRAAERMNRRKNADGKVRSLSKMRLPYTFCLIDMAFILRLLDYLDIMPQPEQPLLEGLYTVLFN
jgi:hypothetical protein